MDIEDLVVKSRLRLLIRYPFFGYLISNLDIKFDSSLLGDAMAGIDILGHSIYINKEAISKYIERNKFNPQKVVLFILFHEVLHYVYDTLGRKRSDMDHELWNIASDFGINRDIEQSLNYVIPEVYHSSFFYDSTWYHERIYDYLKENTTKQEDSDFTVYIVSPDCTARKRTSGSVPGKLHVLDPILEGSSRTIGDKEAETIRRNISLSIINAYNYCRNSDQSSHYSSIPASVRRIIKDALYPKLPWRDMLADFIVGSSNEDYNFNRPDNAYLQQSDIIMPTLYSTAIKVMVAIDTSGSISSNELKVFLGELKGVVSSYSNSEIVLVFCDAKVHYHSIIHNFDDIDFDSIKGGGGGTDFRPVFKLAEEQYPDVSGIVYLTDGVGSYPNGDKIFAKTLWVLSGSHSSYYTPKFGTIAYLN